jgi:chorismate synthase
VRHGETQGGPVAVQVGNTEWPKWETVMAADPVDEAVLAEQARNAPLTRPRPGHADLVGMQKYDFDERGRCSSGPVPGRPRPGSPSAGWPNFLAQALGRAGAEPRGRARHGRGPSPAPLPQPTTWRRSTPTRCAASTRRPARPWWPRSQQAQKDGDTLGGVVEVVAWGLPPGLGSHVHWDRRLDARLAAR